MVFEAVKTTPLRLLDLGGTGLKETIALYPAAGRLT